MTSPRGALRTTPALRQLWSLLYRATRRQAVRVDELTRRVAALDEGHGLVVEDVQDQREDVLALLEQMDQLRSQLHDLANRVDLLAGLDDRVDLLDGLVERVALLEDQVTGDGPP